MKYIVSFTTTPSRISKCEQMLFSILNQSRKPDLIILNIPKIFARTGEEYVIPENISKLVLINIVEKDLGPCTKIVPSIKYLKDNNYDVDNTYIIYLDDDIFYPYKMIEYYEKNTKEDNNSIFGLSGWDYIELQMRSKRLHNDTCSVIEGFGSVCVKLSVFGDDFFEYINHYIEDDDCRFSDDLILSNYYHQEKIKLKILNDGEDISMHALWKNERILDYGKLDDALHQGANGITETNSKRYLKVIHVLHNNKNLFLPLFFRRYSPLVDQFRRK